MEVWFNFEKSEIVLEPQSAFECSFLTDLLGTTDALTCTTLLSEIDKSVVGITIKPHKSLANGSTLTTEEIDKMYEEMTNE